VVVVRQYWFVLRGDELRYFKSTKGMPILTKIKSTIKLVRT
jgi:hypothetical protein